MKKRVFFFKYTFCVSRTGKHLCLCNLLETGFKLNFTFTVGYATMNDATTNECYNEQFL